MKKLLFIPAILLMMAGNLACNEDNTTKGIKPILPEKEISAFFEEHLPIFSMTSEPECFFVGDDLKTNNCIIINNVDEFRKSFSCLFAMLPAIDFKSYSLIIGHHQMPGTGYCLVEQSIIVESKKIELNIDVKIPEGSLGVLCPLYYWGIYPKLQNKTMNVNIKYQ